MAPEGKTYIPKSSFYIVQQTTEHILDTTNAPRGQLPYIVDGEQKISDSNRIICYLTEKYKISLDDNITSAQKSIHFLVTRMLDNHLYWVISYSRWQDERFWPFFKAEFLKQLGNMPEKVLEDSKKYNIEKYHYQGISRYTKEEIYQSGIEDLNVISSFLGSKDFFFGKTVHIIDACCYAFLANIFYFDINTPLKDFIASDTNLSAYIHRVRELLHYT